MPTPKAALAIVTAMCVLTATACSLGASATQNIIIMPNHQGAQVSVDGAPIGKGTQTVQMRRKSDHTVTAQCGSSTGAAHVDRNISTTGMLDLIGGLLILVPFIGVVAPGFWDLSPRTVVVVVPDISQCPGADIEVPPGKPGS